VIHALRLHPDACYAGEVMFDPSPLVVAASALAGVVARSPLDVGAS